MPAGVLFLVILVSTTLEVLADRTRSHYREKRWRKTLRDHIIVCGYGVKGQAAIATLLATDREPGDDRRHRRARRRRRGGAAAAASPGSWPTRARQSALEAAGIREAAAVVVAPDRDDTAVLITLTARELNPRARIVASVREAENAHLLEQGGADSVVVSSGAAGRLLGHAVHSPRVVQVLEDLLSVGSGLDIIEREVRGGRRRPAAGRGALGGARDRRRARRARAALRRPRASATCEAGRPAGLPLHQRRVTAPG